MDGRRQERREHGSDRTSIHPWHTVTVYGRCRDRIRRLGVLVMGSSLVLAVVVGACVADGGSEEEATASHAEPSDPDGGTAEETLPPTSVACWAGDAPGPCPAQPEGLAPMECERGVLYGVGSFVGDTGVCAPPSVPRGFDDPSTVGALGTASIPWPEPGECPAGVWWDGTDPASGGPCLPEAPRGIELWQDDADMTCPDGELLAVESGTCGVLGGDCAAPDSWPRVPHEHAGQPRSHVHPDGNDDAPGTAEEPLRTLDAALERFDGSGVVLLAPGTHEMNTLHDGVVLVGGCASAVELVPASGAAVRIEEPVDVTLSGLSLRGGGVEVRHPEARVALDNVQIRAVPGSAIVVADGRLELTRVAIRGDADVFVGPQRRGISVFGGGQVIGESVDIRGVEAGMLASSDSVVDLRGVFIDGIARRTDEPAVGSGTGVWVQQAASVRLSRVVIGSPRLHALTVRGEGVLEVRDAHVRGLEDGLLVLASAEGRLTMERVLLRRHGGTSLRLVGSSVAGLSDIQVSEGTAAASTGLSVAENARVSLERLRIADQARAAVEVAGSALLTLEDVVLERIGEHGGALSIALRALGEAGIDAVRMVIRDAAAFGLRVGEESRVSIDGLDVAGVGSPEADPTRVAPVFVAEEGVLSLTRARLRSTILRVAEVRNEARLELVHATLVGSALSTSRSDLGLVMRARSSALLTDVDIFGGVHAGIVLLDDTTAQLADVRVRDIMALDRDGFGVGIAVTDRAEVQGRGVLLEDLTRNGLRVQQSASVWLQDLVIREIRRRSEDAFAGLGEASMGVTISGSGLADLDRVWIRDVDDVGIVEGIYASSVRNAVVGEIAAVGCTPGHASEEDCLGIGVSSYSRLRLRRVVLERCPLAGLQVVGSGGVRGEDLTIRSSLVGVNVQVPSFSVPTALLRAHLSSNVLDVSTQEFSIPDVEGFLSDAF